MAEMHGGHSGGGMSHDDREQMLRMHHQQTLWVYWTLVVLGIWTLAVPFSFGYANSSQWVEPSGGRGAWWSESTHNELGAWLMVWSDVLAGAARWLSAAGDR